MLLKETAINHKDIYMLVPYAEVVVQGVSAVKISAV